MSGRVYHIALRSYLCTGERGYQHRAFCRDRNLSVPVFTAIAGDLLYRIFGFTEARHAREFREQFDGVIFFEAAALKPAGWLEWDGSAQFVESFNILWP